MHHLTDILHVVLKHAIGRWVSNHETCQLLLMLLDLQVNYRWILTTKINQYIPSLSVTSHEAVNHGLLKSCNPLTRANEFHWATLSQSIPCTSRINLYLLYYAVNCDLMHTYNHLTSPHLAHQMAHVNRPVLIHIYRLHLHAGHLSRGRVGTMGWGGDETHVAMALPSCIKVGHDGTQAGILTLSTTVGEGAVFGWKWGRWCEGLGDKEGTLWRWLGEEVSEEGKDVMGWEMR